MYFLAQYAKALKTWAKIYNLKNMVARLCADRVGEWARVQLGQGRTIMAELGQEISRSFSRNRLKLKTFWERNSIKHDHISQEGYIKILKETFFSSLNWSYKQKQNKNNMIHTDSWKRENGHKQTLLITQEENWSYRK